MAAASAVPAAGAGDLLLQVDGLGYSAGTQDLFRNWACRVAPGVTLVRGGEGTGKSSLLRLLAGALPADSGDVRIGGIHLAAQPEAYRRQVFLADPRTEAFDHITPRAYLASLHARHPGFDDRCADALIDQLSLTEHQHKPLYMLSTGSKRKVWFTAAVVSGAPLTLLDDPFAALDRRSIGVVSEVLQDAARTCDRIWILADYEAPSGVPLAGVVDLG